MAGEEKEGRWFETIGVKGLLQLGRQGCKEADTPVTPDEVCVVLESHTNHVDCTFGAFHRPSWNQGGTELQVWCLGRVCLMNE